MQDVYATINNLDDERTSSGSGITNVDGVE